MIFPLGIYILTNISFTFSKKDLSDSFGAGLKLSSPIIFGKTAFVLYLVFSVSKHLHELVNLPYHNH